MIMPDQGIFDNGFHILQSAKNVGHLFAGSIDVIFIGHRKFTHQKTAIEFMLKMDQS